jgi:hypothetical protein
MRVVVALLAVAFVVLVGGQSYAQTFPDLPGMNTVAKQTHTQAPSASRSVSAPSTTQSNKAPTSNVSSAASSSIKAADVAPILQMPGSRSLPIIRDYNAGLRTRTVPADLLAVLAAIGTATSLGMLWAVRRRFDRA